MRDPIVKRFEVSFRRSLIRILGHFIHRQKQPQNSNDFNSSKILFVRQDRIGDVLISTPIFASIKVHYPSATIDFLLSENNCFVLDNDPLIHRRWIYHKDILRIIPLIRALRKERYDYAVDMTDNQSATSTLLCLFAGAKWNVGLAKENSYAYDIVVPMLSRRDTHIIDRIAQLLTAFRIDPKTEKLSIRYFTSSESDEFAERFIAENKLLQRRIIGINISAGGNARFWGIQNYRELLSYIIDKHPELSPIILYQPSDIEKASEIAGSNSHAVLSPVTKTFDQFASIIKKITFLISPDTSAIHLASAFGIPSVVLYVQSDKNLRIWEPYNIENETLITEIDDLSTIPLPDVLASLERLINNAQRH